MPATVILEEPGSGPVPALHHAGWVERWPWLVQGLTTAGSSGDWDLALFGQDRTASVLERWETLLATFPVAGGVHSRQVHGDEVRFHPAAAEGLLVAPACDGHLTQAPGLLLTASVADCVPVYLVSSTPRTVGVVHAGWRGAAAGILERALGRMDADLGVDATELHVHLGPSICGACYEVGPEVHEALGEPTPAGPTPVDLRRNLARRAEAAGVPADQISISGHCTRCGDAGLFSHRGGSPGRQMAFVGIRDGS